MTLEPKYKVYLAEPLGFSDSPFIITTAYTNAGGYPMGEWFLVVPKFLGDQEGDCNLFARRVLLRQTSVPVGPATFNEEFLLNELLNQAKGRLRTYIFETKGREALPLLAKRPEVIESNANLFVNFRLNRTFGSCLDDIMNETKCEPLAETLELVLQWPEFRSEDIMR
jgi:hypothetical protein